MSIRKKRFLSQLAMRWSDGGGDPAPAPAPAPAPPPAPAPTPAPAAPPAPAPAPAPKPSDPAKTYTEAELEAAKADALAAYKQHLEEAKDYEKMTAEEKVAYLEAKAIDDKLTAYTTQKLSADALPIELAKYAKGKDEAETDGRVKELKELIAKGVQAGVEARFKGNAFVPRGSATGATATADNKTRPRGVSIQ